MPEPTDKKAKKESNKQRKSGAKWIVSLSWGGQHGADDACAEKLARELKEANSERRRLIKELAKRETSVLDEKRDAVKTRDLGGIRILIRHFEGDVSVDRMVQTANEMIKKDSRIVTIFYGSNEKTARLLVMAGKHATERGINAEQAMREVSSVIGGGGGGTPSFAQGGGVLIDKLPEAVRKVEELLKTQLHA